MIQFIPSVIDENGIYVYTCRGDCEGAFIKSCLVESKVKILSINGTNGDPFVIEGLIRSALNYGANRCAYIACVSSVNIDETSKLIFERMGFSKNEVGYEAEIPVVLTGSCCHCKNI